MHSRPVSALLKGATEIPVSRRIGVSQRAKLQALLADLQATTDGASRPCNTAIDEYEEQRVTEHHLAHKSIESYRGCLRKVRRDIGEVIVGDLTSRHVSDHLSNIGRGSLATHFSVLSACFHWLDRNGYPGMGALVPRKRPKSRRRDVALTDAQYTALGRWMGVARARRWVYPRMYDALAVAVLVPFRRGELASLRWSECDLGSRIVSLYATKTGDRVIPVSKMAASILARQPRLSRCVFPPMRGKGAHVDDSALTHAFNRITRRAISEGADLPDGIRFHDLRHSWASKAIRDGWPMPLVSQVMGHSDAHMTRRYVHLRADDLRDIVDGLEKSLLAGLPEDQIEATWS